MLWTVVCHVEVVGQFRMFWSYRVDSFYGRQYSQTFTVIADFDHLLFHAAGRILYQAGNLEVRETETFSFTQHIGRKLIDLVVLFNYLWVTVNVFQFLKEPGADFSQIVNLLNGITFFKRCSNGEHAHIGWIGQFVIQIFEFQIVVAYKTVHALSDHTQTLLHNLFEALTDGHDFTDRFHAWSDTAWNAGKFAQIPTGNLADHIVEFRSDIGRVGSSHLADFVQCITQGQFGGYESQRIAGCFWCQSWRAA